MPKISQLPQLPSLTADDLFIVVNDPSGSPATKNATVQSLSDFIESGLGTMAGQNQDNVTITGGTISVTGLFNAGLTLATNTFSTARVSVRSAITDFKVVADSNIFTVPTGYMFLVDTMEIVTTGISSAGTPPKVRFGVVGDAASLYASSLTTSNSLGQRHVVENPQNGLAAGTVVTFGITEASTAATHSGVAVVGGYLLKTS